MKLKIELKINTHQVGNLTMPTIPLTTYTQIGRWSILLDLEILCS